MIELTFYDFHDHYYEIRDKKFPHDFFQLYVMKNGLGDVLYVGISTVDVWGRWFGWGGHMVWEGKIVYGESSIGIKIENHLPDSLNWKIQLWSLDDCLDFCKDEAPVDLSQATINLLEPIMIQKLSPALNVTFNNNPGKDSTPPSRKELEQTRKLDQLYRDHFNKK